MLISTYIYYVHVVSARYVVKGRLMMIIVYNQGRKLNCENLCVRYRDCVLVFEIRNKKIIILNNIETVVNLCFIAIIYYIIAI